MTRLLVQTGGPVQLSRRYFARSADRELPDALREGALCALFAPRQEGKTSLMIRTAWALAADGARCATVDLGMTSPSTASSKELFDFLTSQIGAELTEDVSPSSTSGGSAFVHWLTDVATRSTTQIVLFFDEIHQMLEAPELSEELLQAIRVLQEGKARTPSLSRLSICVSGVARPRDLVRDPAKNPFDVGKTIRLEDFTLDELAPLRSEFASAGMPEALVDHIFRWTSGHPFMTSKLVRELVEQPFSGDHPLAEHVDDVVKRTLMAEAYASEHYLTDARLLFEKSARFGDANMSKAIEIYRSLLRRETIRESDAGDSGVVLTLAGVAAGRTRNGVRLLEARNRITAELFDQDWLEQMEVNRRLNTPLQLWEANGRSTSSLLVGPDLEAALAVAKRAHDVSQEQRAFLLSCIEVSTQKEIVEAKTKAEVFYSTQTVENLERARNAVRRSQLLIAITGMVVLALVAVVWSLLSARHEASGLRAHVRDLATLTESLQSAVNSQKETEAKRLSELTDTQQRAARAEQDALDATKRANNAMANATADREALEKRAQAARDAALRLKDDVDAARHDYNDAVTAVRAAERRAKDAEESLQVAQQTRDALRAELDARKAVEQKLSDERIRSARFETDLDSARRELDALRLQKPASCEQRYPQNRGIEQVKEH